MDLDQILAIHDEDERTLALASALFDDDPTITREALTRFLKTSPRDAALKLALGSLVEHGDAHKALCALVVVLADERERARAALKSLAELQARVSDAEGLADLLSAELRAVEATINASAEPKPPGDLLSVSEALAALGGISRAHLYNLIARGTLTRVKVGGRTFFRRADVEGVANV